MKVVMATMANVMMTRVLLKLLVVAMKGNGKKNGEDGSCDPPFQLYNYTYSKI